METVHVKVEQLWEEPGHHAVAEASPGPMKREPQQLPVIINVKQEVIDPQEDLQNIVEKVVVKEEPKDGSDSETLPQNLVFGENDIAEASPGPMKREPQQLPVIINVKQEVIDPQEDLQNIVEKVVVKEEPKDGSDSETLPQNLVFGENEASPGPMKREPQQLPVIINVKQEVIDPQEDLQNIVEKVLVKEEPKDDSDSETLPQVFVENLCVKVEGEYVKEDPEPSESETEPCGSEMAAAVDPKHNKKQPPYSKMRTRSRAANTNTEASGGPHSPDVCTESFECPSLLKLHMTHHTGNNSFACEMCQSKFANLTVLKIHLRSHTGEKPYKCKTCKKKFTQIGSLKKHERIHTGEKPYSCETCKKKFSQKTHLKTHERIHTGEKPFICESCNKKFGLLSTLKAHRRTHTGEKPYVCEICKKTFAKSNTLKTHERTHTGEKPYSCGICEKAFTALSILSKHKRIHSRTSKV